MHAAWRARSARPGGVGLVGYPFFSFFGPRRPPPCFSLTLMPSVFIEHHGRAVSLPDERARSGAHPPVRGRRRRGL